MTRKCTYCDNASIGYLFDTPVKSGSPRTIRFCAEHQKIACAEVERSEQYESAAPLFTFYLSDEMVLMIKFGGPGVTDGN